ncbi:Phosphotyrosyl phosphatase activator [Lipomyces arxii]|uniref:Phosphotyrosyl phosphatase activator n=1 Tax=Lipomyces arxii TaxID=56418 RepID=UPI0034CD1719
MDPQSEVSTPTGESFSAQFHHHNHHHREHHANINGSISPPQVCYPVFPPPPSTVLRRLIHSHGLEKRIHSANDLVYFVKTTGYARIQFLLAFISNVVAEVQTPRSEEGLSPGISGILKIIDKLDSLVTENPPVTGPRRFGNPAYKTWYTAVENAIGPLIEEMLNEKSVPVEATVELKGYLMGGLGSNQRLDFGTGHELSFMAFFGGCFYLGALRPVGCAIEHDEEDTGGITGKEVLCIFDRYFKVIRRVVRTYTLEPAGSHGVWGLDDHFHLPYIIGAAQLRGIEERLEPPQLEAEKPQLAKMMPPARKKKKESEMTLYGIPRPSAVMNKDIVEAQKDVNIYFSAIAFIYEVKKGPFFEHSPVLYDISGIHLWSKVHGGLLKMYNAEVLGKFPVVQHFGFGNVLYPWTTFGNEA